MDINWPETDPLAETRRSFRANVCVSVREGPLKTAFYHYEVRGELVLDSMLTYARKLIVSVDVQVWWWMKPLTEFPFRWVAVVDPRRPAAEVDQIYHEGWSLCICCKSQHFDRKIPFVYPTLQQLKDCKCFKASCTSMGKHAKVTNMHLERVLSLTKSATPAKLPHAERLCGAALLLQFLKPRLAEGGADPPHNNQGATLEGQCAY